MTQVYRDTVPTGVWGRRSPPHHPGLGPRYVSMVRITRVGLAHEAPAPRAWGEREADIGDSASIGLRLRL